MGRKKAVIIEEDGDEEIKKTGVLEEIQDAKEIERLELTDEWISDFQERFSDQPAKVLVEKYDDTGEWCYCKKYTLASFDVDQIKEEFGGGKYRASLYADGHYVKTGRRHFKVSDPVFKRVEERKPENPLENPIVAMMIESMKSQQVSMLELTKSMIAAQAGKSGGLGEVVEAMKAVNALTPKTDKPLDNFKETLGIMKLVKELSGEGEESSEGLLGNIKEFLGMLPALKEQMANMKPAGNPSLAPGTPDLPQTITVAGGPPPMDPLTKKIVDLIPKFVGGARANAPVPDWGNYLLEVLDTEVMPVLLPVLKEKYKPLVQNEDDVYDLLIKYAKDPSERLQLFKTIPPLAPHAEWCLKVIDEAVRLIELPDTPVVSNGSDVVLEAVKDN